MLAEALYHVTGGSWAYAYNDSTVHLRLRVKRNDADEVFVLHGDKYDWQHTVQECPMERIAADSLFDYWQCDLNPPLKRMVYAFRLRSGEEAIWLCESGIQGTAPGDPGNCFEYPYLHEADLFLVPEWAKNAVFYQIMPDRFAPNEEREDSEGLLPWGSEPDLHSSYGGNLKAITNKLGYLEELGVNAIYFTPLFASPSCHKYDISDYKQVDPLLGDMEQLKQLVDKCHKKGIYVVLDAVFNHCSEQFEPFLDVLRHGEESRYKDWFHIHSYPIRGEDGQPFYETFGNYGHMPKLNTANPEVRDYLLEVTRYWMRETGIDGWRLDVANEIDRRFWREFRLAVKEINPDAYIIGECWSDAAPWLQGDQFDSAMNYPLSMKILDFFSADSLNAGAFAEIVAKLSVRYPQQAHEVLFNLLGSHDTARLASRLPDKRKLKHAVLFLLTTPGTPCIFYGDEYGMTGDNDPGCRKSMEWDPDKQDGELWDFYKMMIHLRRNTPALCRGRYRMLQAGQDSPCLLYERIAAGSHIMVWINHSPEPGECSHPMEADDWKDALTGEQVFVQDGRLTVSLEGYGFRIIERSWKEEGG
ncbi:MAG: alpha amylase catalytic subunit [Paenibacillaceae bacterium]|jgi:glycosidase|nr:alpha amylase catalytic subunit [Paenibacillaceae bacterium]